MREKHAATENFGRCLFDLAERRRTQHFVKKIGGYLPAAYTAWEVATAVTAANCGSYRQAFLSEVGFPGQVGSKSNSSNSGGDSLGARALGPRQAASARTGSLG